MTFSKNSTPYVEDISHTASATLEQQLESQLSLCKTYFNNKEYDKFNATFPKLMAQNYPPALLANVDFLFHQDPNQAIGYLLKLAQNDVENANVKMAMLLYFHPELTLDFRTFLTRSCQLEEVSGIIAAANIFYQLKLPSAANNLLAAHKHLPQIDNIIARLSLQPISKENGVIPYEKLARPNNENPKIHVSNEINLYYVDDMLSEFGAEILKLSAEKQLETAYVVNGENGEMIKDPARTNRYSQLYPADFDWVLLDLEQRISSLCAIERAFGEVGNIMCYQQGEEYKAHYDFFHPRDPGSAVAMKDSGQRIRTAICYLQTCEEGGNTRFPRLEKTVEGKLGRVVVFDNVDFNFQPLPLSLHQGEKVEKGEKWIFTKWFREKTTEYKQELARLNL